MNKIHKWSLHLLLKNYMDDIQDLLMSSGYISIHQRCINYLLTEVYKDIHGLSPEVINDVFSTTASIYNIQQFNVFETSHSYLGQIWIEFDTLQSQLTLELTS